MTTHSHKPIVIKELAKKIGAKSPSFGKPELLMETLGVIPGSVTPFGVVNDKKGRVKLILDEEMMAHPVLNFHPLVNTATTTIASADFIRFLDACPSEYEIIAL